MTDACPQGHPWTAETSYFHPRTGARACRKCKNLARAGKPVRSEFGSAIRRAKAIVAERRHEWLARYEAGEDLKVLAEESGVALSTVSKAIRGLGGTIRKRGFGSSSISGPANPAWRGGSYVHNGYRYMWVPDTHKMASMRRSKGYVLEHRLVMAIALGRALADHETVHHINGDTLDNRPENLQLRQGKHGKGVHVRCGDCGSANVVASLLA